MRRVLVLGALLAGAGAVGASPVERAAEDAQPDERGRTPHDPGVDAPRDRARRDGDGFRLGDLFRGRFGDPTRGWQDRDLPTEFPDRISTGRAHSRSVSRSVDGVWVDKPFRNPARAALYVHVYRLLAREGVPVLESHERAGHVIQRAATGLAYDQLSARAQVRADREIARVVSRVDRVLGRHAELGGIEADRGPANYFFDRRGRIREIVDPVAGPRDGSIVPGWGLDELPTRFPEHLARGRAHVRDVAGSADGRWVEKSYRNPARAVLYAEAYRLLAREGVPVLESHERDGRLIQRRATGLPIDRLEPEARARARRAIDQMATRVDRILAHEQERRGRTELRDVFADRIDDNYFFDPSGRIVAIVDPIGGPSDAALRRVR